MGPTRTSPNLLKMKPLVGRALELRGLADRFRRLGFVRGRLWGDDFILLWPNLQGQTNDFADSLWRSVF
jgi:hypothetical protein